MTGRRILAGSIEFCLLGLCCAITAAADEATEPPLEYTVKVGEKTVTISEGTPVRLEGTFTNPSVTITPKPFRVFSVQGVKFNYPKAFVFEADLSDPDAKFWTLSGNDVKISYDVLAGPLTARELADEMIAEFGRNKVKNVNQNAKLRLGKETLKGTSFVVEVVSTVFIMDVYHVQSEATTSRFLVIQDTLNEKGERTKEGQETLKEIKKSFVLER